MNSLPVWTPALEDVQNSRMNAFMGFVRRRHELAATDYDALYTWSIAQPEHFWQAVWDFCGVNGTAGATVLEARDALPGANWFPQARLNFAQNLLRRRDEADALIFSAEGRTPRRISHAALYAQVAQLAAAMRGAGVVAGDRVAAYLPNLPETIAVMLAAASLGAVFSSCSPDFGAAGVVDRFAQITPKLLFAADGYYYDGKPHDSLAKLPEIIVGLPTLEKVVIIPYLAATHDLTPLDKAQAWAAFLSPHAQTTEIEWAVLPFNHPLYILYSSGTTGVPKCLVHGAGGTLLQHLKEHQLHSDIKPGDRLFYFTTTGWMMWHWLASGLASGATLLLYDGAPLARQGRTLFEFVTGAQVTHLGLSAKFIDALQQTDMRPRDEFDWAALRVIFSTGSPLAPQGFDFIYEYLKADVNLASIAGGTDIISCFVLGNPLLPVRRGEIQCRGLGLAVEIFDEAGQSVRGVKGELVCTKPFPSMPLGFWGDADGSKYRAAYFARFPNVWTHGDYAEITSAGGIIIYGRSDATLNPGGVRIGTAEIYRQVERLPAIAEALVIGQDWRNDVRVVLFVKLRAGVSLDEDLARLIRAEIRRHTSPRHVPAKIIAVTDIPRTKSGKIVELAVREVVHGRPVKNLNALVNPEALNLFVNLPELSY